MPPQPPPAVALVAFAVLQLPAPAASGGAPGGKAIWPLSTRRPGVLDGVMLGLELVVSVTEEVREGVADLDDVALRVGLSVGDLLVDQVTVDEPLSVAVRVDETVVDSERVALTETVAATDALTVGLAVSVFVTVEVTDVERVMLALTDLEGLSEEDTEREGVTEPEMLEEKLRLALNVGEIVVESVPESDIETDGATDFDAVRDTETDAAVDRVAEMLEL